MKYGLAVRGLYRVHGCSEPEIVLKQNDADDSIYTNPKMLVGNSLETLSFVQAQELFGERTNVGVFYDSKDFRTYPKAEFDLGSMSGESGKPMVLDELFGGTTRGKELLARVMKEVPRRLPLEVSVFSQDVQREANYRNAEMSQRHRSLLDMASMRDLTVMEQRKMIDCWPYVEVKLPKETRKMTGMNVSCGNLDIMSAEKYAAHPSNVMFYSVNTEAITREGVWEFSFPTFKKGYLLGKISADEVEIRNRKEEEHFAAASPFEHVIEVKFPLHKGFGKIEFLVAQISREE